MHWGSRQAEEPCRGRGDPSIWEGPQWVAVALTEEEVRGEVRCCWEVSRAGFSRRAGSLRAAWPF